jgi:coenzyme Q-binding protein COQ10
LKNRWDFRAVPEGTRLEFVIDFAFRSPLLNAALQANFDRAVSLLIASFETEAKRRYGPPS